MKNKDIAIVGAGGFGKEVKMLIDGINKQKSIYNLIGFYDDGLEKGTKVNGCPVLGQVCDINNYQNDLAITVAVGDPVLKLKLLNKINNPFVTYPTLIHPTVIIGEDSVSIGEGCILLPGNMLTVNINIGCYVSMHLNCTVGHDTKIDDYCSFMPGVNVSGEVVIGEGVYAGTGASIINQMKIGRWTIIGAGAVVSSSLPEKCTAVGVPARPIKFND